MKVSATTHTTPSTDAAFRGGLASFLLHAVLLCILLATGIYYRKFSFPPELTSPARLAPINLTVAQIIPPEPIPPPIGPPLPASPLAPAAPHIPVPMPNVPTAKAKPSAHKRDGLATHHTHKEPPRAIPTAPQPPIAKPLPLTAPPKALPVLPPPSVVKTTPKKVPVHPLPVVPPVVAPAGPPKPSPRALAVKPKPAIIPTLPAEPPPRALPVPVPQPVVHDLPPVPPPKAIAVEPAPEVVHDLPPVAPPKAIAVEPAPVTIPAPTPFPAPEVAPVAATTSPSTPEEPSTAPPPLATPDFVLVPGPDRTIFPQPPYPYSARNRGLSGTVVMNVQFDDKGAVIFAEVSQSSGVPILDEATKSFIRRHWHLPVYAGKSVSVPVIYELDKR